MTETMQKTKEQVLEELANTMESMTKEQLEKLWMVVQGMQLLLQMEKKA